ncbi:MAG: class I SAM-dependent methyltransferase [Erysipelotrichaceae bacterium]
MGGQTVETLNYCVLADFYDALVKDEEATNQWVAYTKQRVKGKKILELACGSGEITLALADEGYQLDALDLSGEMINRARLKDTANKICYMQGDMLDLSAYGTYDAILCYCDSINYLHPDQLDILFSEVSRHLNENGIFLFDMHTPGRLIEFEEPFIEEGWIDTTAYQWAIESDSQRVIHHFRFYFADGHVITETHVQHVFDLDVITRKLATFGFGVSVTSDFEEPADHEAEKYFICARKGDIL